MKHENEIREIIQKTIGLGMNQFYVSVHDGSLFWSKEEKLPLPAGTVSEICDEMIVSGLAEKGAVSSMRKFFMLTPCAKDF